MGYGEYSHAAHVALTTARVERPSSPFATGGAHALMLPKDTVREARDSEEHPESLAVVFALDVTGSMGRIPRDLATRTLPDFMQALLDARVTDPQVCFMAVGHASDRAPLQVGQFESSAALIDLWLTRLWLEGGGVGGHEAYELAMLYCARRTRLDCATERGRRGYLFITGDVAPNPAVSRVQARDLLGEALADDLPIRELVEELQRSFEPFVLLAPGAGRAVARAWRDLLGDRVVELVDALDAAWAAAGLVALLEGSVPTLPAFVDRLQATGVGRKDAVRVAIALTPFAASIGRDGVPKPSLGHGDLPAGDPPSGMVR